MAFTKSTISFFRGFKDLQTLQLAIPDNKKEGSGLTYVVGENNTGKTTVIEGLLLRNKQKIRSSEVQTDGNPEFTLVDEHAVVVRKLLLLREGSYTLNEDPILPDAESFESVPSRRNWDSSVSGELDLNYVLNQTIKERPRDGSNTRVSNALQAIESNDEDYKNFIMLVQRVLPEFSSFAIGYEDSEFVEYKTQNGVKHKTNFLGDGVVSVLRILIHLFKESNRPLVIDEPELSLHPLAQKRLHKIIAECSKTRQIVIATHSPYFVSWDYIKNGATLNKVSKYADNKSEIHSLGSYSKYEKLISGASWKQPFLMDIVAKEIFFHDNFLFVEGQEDVGLLKKDNSLIENINLFGYGVRGSGSFKFALQLAKDLGIKKAAVILDAGIDEKAIRTDLEATFSAEGYCIVQWNKADIRDKEAYSATAKEGYFNPNGDKKETGKLDDFEEKIDVINTYFS